jgi:hypothetical protein
MSAMNIYFQEDEFIIDLREWCKNNPLEIPKDATQKYGAVVGEKMPEVTKQVLREINLGKKLSEETKQKISQSLKGVVPWNLGIPNTKKQKEKISNTLSKNWLITFPDRKECQIKNLTKFCKENNLFQSCMILVSQGKQANHKGFICRPVEGTSP